MESALTVGQLLDLALRKLGDGEKLIAFVLQFKKFGRCIDVCLVLQITT